MAQAGELLWEPGPQRSNRANVTTFMRWLGETRGLELDDYHSLWEWSVADIEGFWRAVWDYMGFPARAESAPVLGSRTMPGAEWFPGAQLNFAGHLLARHLGIDGDPDRVAIYHETERGDSRELTWRELNEQVGRLAAELRRLGVEPGDRVGGYLSTSPEAVVALLATTAVGAVWSCCATEFGTQSVLDRYQQVEPKVLITIDGYQHGGKTFDRRDIAASIVSALPSLECVIWLANVFDEDPPPLSTPIRTWHSIMVPPTAEVAGDAPPVDALDVPFDHPLWIVYSSGTTGLPKAIVHGHGGVLLELLKLQHFHFDLQPTSRVFFYTTTGWIVFPVLVSALLRGCSIVLYDGSPTHPDLGRQWQIAAERKVTHFGTSPAFVGVMQAQGYRPADHFDLDALECVMCTGSPLTPESFTWIYDNVASDLWVTSISGGTDVVSALVGGVPTLPVYNGEIQARCLGIDVQAYDSDGQPVIDEEGELVVQQPIPSMPLSFWNDPGGARYLDSYFDTYPGIWHHGDLLRVTSRGTCVISGRSDATLNRHGVRIGTSEVYRVVDAVDGVTDSLVVEVTITERGSIMVLFVLLENNVVLDETLKKTLVAELRAKASARHVPDEILQVTAIPYTLTGKKMEVPVKRILTGTAPERAASRDAMANPAALDEYAALGAKLGPSAHS